MAKGPATKAEFYEGWQTLRFGNRIRIWTSQAELRDSGYAGPVSARSRTIGGPCYYNVPAHEAANVPVYGDLTFNETTPDALLTLQGELTRSTHDGYALFASTDPLPMRKALAASGRQYYGIQALGRVKHHCNDNSFEMLMELLDEYPDAIVEFSCYSCWLGELPGHNTVVWEVREY